MCKRFRFLMCGLQSKTSVILVCDPVALPLMIACSGTLCYIMPALPDILVLSPVDVLQLPSSAVLHLSHRATTGSARNVGSCLTSWCRALSLSLILRGRNAWWQSTKSLWRRFLASISSTVSQSEWTWPHWKPDVFY